MEHLECSSETLLASLETLNRRMDLIRWTWDAEECVHTIERSCTEVRKDCGKTFRNVLTTLDAAQTFPHKEYRETNAMSAELCILGRQVTPREALSGQG